MAFVFIVSLFLPNLNLNIGQGSGPDGPGERLPDQGHQHILQGEEHPPYNSQPASSGWHNGTPARWGVYEFELPDEILVHNLEHAGIRIHYKCPDGCDELVGQLTGLANRYDKVILAPHSDMDTRIALVAWTFIDKFEEYDEDRVVAFVEAHLYSPNAPEPRAR